jgi:glycosyltransferase involved in cell wall biosynthesis
VNVVLISHCDFLGNSAMHVFSVANELQATGVECAVCVPNDPGTVRGHGTPHFRLLHHEDALRDGVVFSDGRGPDLIHAWTPRELVRTLTESLVGRYGVPYLVHLEDNEEIIVEDEYGGASFSEVGRLPLPIIDRLIAPHRSHPVYYPRFLAGAAGVTALMDRLLEFKPGHVPGLVFWPGFDAAFARAEVEPGFRARVGVADGDVVAAYTGNVHRSNVAEVRSLVAAIAALRRRGHPIVLVKTGRNDVEIPYYEEACRQGSLIDLGFCAREDVPRLVAASDVLVQPGHAGDFNDFRFPSKLPEFLVSGRPVLLPRTNIGRFLQDGVEGVLLDEGHAVEIAAKLEPLLADRERRKRIGEGGRAFALRELTWAGSVARVKAFYEVLLGSRPGDDAPAGYVPAGAGASPCTVVAAPGIVRTPRLIAFYLPQFHRIKENDEWWGEGFTEWTNVKRARPNFRGHQQPLLPADLGFYDLAEPEVLERQAELAKSYGVAGFCFYYYWFNGRRLLERPLEQMLARGKPDFPFCVCWANENWSRRWDGSEDDILMRQDYAEGYAASLVRDLVPVLRDTRYITVDGAPLVMVYRVDLLPDAPAAARVWRAVCAEHGIPKIHLAAVQSFDIDDPRPFGFDAAVDFPPHVERALLDPRDVEGVVPGFEGYLEDYERVAHNQVALPLTPYPWYRGAMPAWDNTPRRMKRAHVCVNASPEVYQGWLERIVEQTMARSPVQEPLVFLNAWNEWAEGAFLEPDRVNGLARLKATRAGLCRGVAAYCQHRGLPLTTGMAAQALIEEGVLP